MGTVRYTVTDGEILAENRNGTKRDYLPDPLGSTVALLDSSQAQTDTYTYWPYGEQASSTGSTDTPFRYGGTLGYHRDKASINVKTYVRARYLDHAKCRWMTQDPIGFDGGDWNLYRYVFNNVTTYVDYSGNSLVLPLPVAPALGLGPVGWALGALGLLAGLAYWCYVNKCFGPGSGRRIKCTLTGTGGAASEGGTKWVSWCIYSCEDGTTVIIPLVGFECDPTEYIGPSACSITSSPPGSLLPGLPRPLP